MEIILLFSRIIRKLSLKVSDYGMIIITYFLYLYPFIRVIELLYTGNIYFNVK